MKPKIAVIDDDKEVAGFLAPILSKEGFAATFFSDGKEAAAFLSRNVPDLVLLDLHLPHQASLAVLKQIRQKAEEFKTVVPVIVLTEPQASREDRVAGLDAGADDFVPKPLDTVELLARVRSLLRVQELHKRSQFLATHDGLTRCYNRRFMTEFLHREFERCKRYKKSISFFVLTLNNFRKVNEDLGAEAADELLLRVGFRLQDFFRAVDCVARRGDKEFAVVLPECDYEEAVKLRQRLDGYLTDVLKNKLSFSVGIASFPLHAKEPDALMRAADKAVHLAKAA